MADRTASDEDLMLRLQKSRDETAFNDLFARYRGPIISYIYRLIGNRAEAESIAQESFLRILAKADRYVYPRRFSTWFYTIARNLATDFLKKKRAVVPDDFQALSDAVPGSDDAAAEALVAAGEELGRLAQALAALPLPYREVVILRALQELSYREIADIVGCPESTARSRMDYGLEYLRKCCQRPNRGKFGNPSNETPDGSYK